MLALKITALFFAGLGIAIGVFILVAAWFAPRMLATPFMRWMATGRRLPPTRENQTLVAIWSILIGTHISLSATGHTIPSLVVFVIWLPLAVVVLRRTYARG